MKKDNDRPENTAPPGGILDEAVRRILTVVKPSRIILFGSASPSIVAGARIPAGHDPEKEET